MDRGLCSKAGGVEGVKGDRMQERNIGTAADVKVAEIIS